MVFERNDELIPAAEAVPQTPGTRFIAAEMMNKRGFNPLEKMMDLSDELEEQDRDEGTGRHADRRIRLLGTLAKFFAPQPKALDINVRTDNNFTIQTIDYSTMIQSNQHLIPQIKHYQGPALIGADESPMHITVEAEDSDD